jgi:mannose-1-phosphate guanylyltransferase
MRAVILAGGQGTRLRPLTDHRPKPLVDFMGEPYAVGLLRRLAAAGVDHATFLIAQDPTPFDALVGPGRTLGVAVRAVTEEVPLDTAGAARRLLRGQATGPVLVCNGDVLTDLDLVALVTRHDRDAAVATIALTRVEDTSAFGVVVCDAADRVRQFVEKPAPGTLAEDTVNAGTYVLSPGAFDAFPGDGPLSFERTVFPGLVQRGDLVLGVADDAYWQDLGTPSRYLEGQQAVLDGRCAWPAGHDLHPNGQGALVHAKADVHPDALLGPGVVVGRGCRVEAGAVLRECALHDGVEVGAGARVERAIVGPGARLAPGAQLIDAVVGDAEVVPA